MLLRVLVSGELAWRLCLAGGAVALGLGADDAQAGSWRGGKSGDDDDGLLNPF